MGRSVAVCAVQGAFIEHERRLAALGCSVMELRQAADLKRSFDALVLPGGESTTQGKLLRDLGMLDPLRQLIEEGLPVLGTCAGLILLSSAIEGAGDVAGLDSELAAGRTSVTRLGTLPVSVCRNGYGRQLGSFHCQAGFGAQGERATIPMTFIRAPFITKLGEGVEELAQVDGRVVAVRHRNQLACAFHPELDQDNTVYDLFLSLGQ